MTIGAGVIRFHLFARIHSRQQIISRPGKPVELVSVNINQSLGFTRTTFVTSVTVQASYKGLIRFQAHFVRRTQSLSTQGSHDLTTQRQGPPPYCVLWRVVSQVITQVPLTSYAQHMVQGLPTAKVTALRLAVPELYKLITMRLPYMTSDHYPQHLYTSLQSTSSCPQAGKGPRTPSVR